MSSTRFIKLFILFFLIFFGVKSSAGCGSINNFKKEKADSIFFLIYNSDYISAEAALIQSEKEIDPLILELLKLELMWWKALSENREQAFISLELFIKTSLKNLENNEKEDNSIQKLIYSSYMMRLLNMRNEYLKIPRYYFQINSIVGTINNSAFSAQEKSIFAIYTAVFNIGKSKISFSGASSKTNNYNTLKRYEKSADFIEQSIATYFLGKLYSDLEKMPGKALPYFRKLHSSFPCNKFFVIELNRLERIVTQ